MRPTKYDPKMQAKAELYLESGYKENGRVIPSSIGLALYLGLAHSTVKLWGNNPDFAAFSATLEDIKALQHELLLNEGLRGNFNSAITKLALGNHGYAEKTDNFNDNRHSFDKNTDEELEQIIAGAKAE